METGTSVSVRRRRWPAFALAAYMGLVLYGTLVPLDASSRPGDAGTRVHRVEWIPFSYACPRHGPFCPWDRGANIILFLPVGGLVALLLERRGRLAVRVATALGFAASLAIETAQLFIPSRFPSTADVLCNGLGAWLGAVFVVWLVRRSPQDVVRFRGDPR